LAYWAVLDGLHWISNKYSYSVVITNKQITKILKQATYSNVIYNNNIDNKQDKQSYIKYINMKNIPIA
jgi:hypothetical protein